MINTCSTCGHKLVRPLAPGDIVEVCKYLSPQSGMLGVVQKSQRTFTNMMYLTGTRKGRVSEYYTYHLQPIHGYIHIERTSLGDGDDRYI